MSASAGTAEPDLIAQREGAAGIIRLNRPKAINAVTLEMFRESCDRIQLMALIHQKLYGAVDLAQLDFVVISHRHGDHMGGMSYLLARNPKVQIYAPKEGFGVFGSDLPSAFYRKDSSLAPEERYYGGTPPDKMVFGTAWPQANITLIDKTTEIAPGIHLIALVSEKPGTLELRELSLAVDTPDGGGDTGVRRSPSLHRSRGRGLVRAG